MKVTVRKANPYLKLSVSGDLLILSKCGFTRTTSIAGNKHVISQFSNCSRRGLLRYLRECVSQYRVMVTLTYPHGAGYDGPESKEHLRRFMQEIKRRGSDDDLAETGEWSGFWIMEFQKRGSIHYHLLCTHRVDHCWVAKTWYRICSTDDKRHLHAGTRVEKIRGGRKGIMAYMAKYSAKMEQKVIPDDFGWSGRFWGVSGFRKVVAATTSVPQALQSVPGVINRLKRTKAWIKRCIADGSIQVIHSKTGESGVYSLQNKRVKAEILRQMGMLRVLVAAHSVDDGSFWEFNEHKYNPESDLDDSDYLTWGL